MPITQNIKNAYNWTKGKVVAGAKKLPYSPFSDGLSGLTRLKRGSGYGALILGLAAAALLYARFERLSSYDRPAPKQPPVVTTQVQETRIPFDEPLLVDKALFDKQLDLLNLDVVNGTVTFDAYSVKKTDDCQRRSPQPGDSLSNFLETYKKDCAETQLNITIPFMTNDEMNTVRKTLEQYTTIVLTQPTSRTNVYPSPVGPRGSVDFSVVGRRTQDGFDVVADMENVRFLDGVSSEVLERVPSRLIETIPPNYAVQTGK